jgi:hypothetical protein
MPESKAPRHRYHLLTKPHRGGMPTRDREHRVKHHMVQGIPFPTPRSWSTWVKPEWVMTDPAHKNRQLFITA